MIQNIYSDEQLKSCKSVNENSAFKMPKNIRQVGQVNTTKKIYAEDYVITYIKQLADKILVGEKKAILLGQYIRAEGCINLFINGAVEIRTNESSGDGRISSEVWTEITNCINKYYTDVEIVGWFITKKESPIIIDDTITKMHLDNFAGQDKTLLVYDSLEREEAFYFYERGELKRQQGYYVYYDRNEQMQNYMVETKQPISTDDGYTDTATQKIRNIIEAKNEDKKMNGLAPFAYTAGSLLAVVVLVIGATMANNAGNNGNIVNVMSNGVVNSTEGIKEENDEEMVTQVNSIQSSITPDTNIDDSNTALVDQSKINENDVEGMIRENNEASVLEQDTDKSQTSSEESDKNEKETEEKKDKVTPVSKKKTNSKADKEVSKPVKDKSYTVKKGDTLVDISYSVYGTILYVNKLKEANHIVDENLIYEGQVLKIPVK